MRKADAGFTLVEALVAMAVFTLVISALYQGLSGGWRGLRRADASELALGVAEARLASAGIETPLEASTQSGVTPDGVAWTTEISLYIPPGGQTAPPSPIVGYWVAVTVKWKEGPLRPEQSLHLKTVKLRRGG